MDQFCPLIFRSGIIHRATDDRQEIFGQPHSWNRTADDGHDIDDDKFVLGKAQARMDQSECGVNEENEKKKQEDGASCTEVDRHKRTAEHHISIGCSDTDANGDDDPGEQGSPGYARPLFILIYD